MRLITNWRQIVRKAWSFRLMFLAGLFTTAEAILPMFVDSIPRGLFSAFTGLAITGGMVARVVAQKEFKDAE